MGISKDELLRRVQEDSFFDKWNHHRHRKNRNFLQLKPKYLIELYNDCMTFIITFHGDSPEKHISSKNRFLTFCEIAETLNPQMFWLLFGFFYRGTDFTFQLEDELRRLFTKDRMNISLSDRTGLSNILWAMDVYGYRNKQFHLLKPDGFLRPFMGKFLKKIKYSGVNNYLTVYRGITIKKEEGIPIKDPNKDGGQIFGKGFSYSLSRDVAVLFATRNNIFEEYDELGLTQWKHQKYWRDDKEFRDLLIKSPEYQKDVKPKLVDKHNKIHQKRYEGIKGFNYGDDVRSVVVTYTVHKKDIVTLLNLEKEEEFFILPEKVKLKRYDFLTIEDFRNPDRFYWKTR